MLKVLRKYNKMILVVGGTLLLISFLIPQAIQQLGQARLGRAVGAMDGRKITAARYDEASRQLTALNEFFRRIGGGFPIALEDGEETEHWILLRHEAEQAGMVGGAREGESLLPVLAQQIVVSVLRSQYGQLTDWFMQQQPDQVQEMVQNAQANMASARNTAAGATRMTYEEFDKALATLRGVTRMLETYTTAERISDRQTIAIAKSLADSILVDAAFLNARELADESLEPTPEQLQAHFDRFREIAAGEGEFGIGYKLPPRVKLAWLGLSRPAIEGAVKVSMLDATRHYHENRDRFAGEFEAERAAVEAELRARKADRIMRSAEAIVASEILRATRPLEESGEYFVLPEDWASRRPSYLQIAEHVVSSIEKSEGVRIPTPEVHVMDGSWLDRQRLSELPGIGSSMVSFGRQSYSFPEVALAVRELAGDTALGLQVGIPVTDLAGEGSDGSRYYYTILAAAPDEVPKSIDQVLDREQMVEDWRALHRYEELAASTSELASRAAAEGLESFAASFGSSEPEPPAEEGAEPAAGTPKVTVIEDARVLEDQTRGLRAVENSAEVIEAVRERAEQIDPLMPIDQVPLEQRVLATPVPSSLGLLVAQINGIQPLTWETLPNYADIATRMHWQRTFEGVGIPFPFRFEPLKERHDFSMRDLRGDDDEEPSPEPATEPVTEPATGTDAG